MKTYQKIEESDNIISRKEKRTILKWQILTLIGLNLAYVFVVSKAFAYKGIYLFEFSSFKIVIGFLVLISALSIGYRIKNPYYFAVWNIIYIYILGGEVVYYQYNPSTSMVQMISIYSSLLFLYLLSKKNIKLKKVKTLKNSDLLLGIITIIMIIPFIILFYKDINLNNLLFIDVYKTRAIYRAESNIYTSYTMAILTRILLPTLIVKKMQKKQNIMLLVYAVIMLYLYLCGALKSVFIGLVAIILFYKGSYVDKTKLFLKGVSFLTWGGVLAYVVFDNIFLLDALGRRVFFTPPALGNIYYNFFKGNYTYLSHSPFGLGLVNYPYELGITSYVGNVVMGTPGLNANIGLYTEGIFSFGLFGGIFFALIVSIIFSYFNMIEIDKRYFGLVFIYIYYVNTALLSTLLLTHGLFLFMMIAYFFLRTKRKT